MADDLPTYPEGSAEDELRNARLQVLIYRAIVTAANDAHAVLDILLEAEDRDAARRALQERYGFSEVQASAVLDLQLGRVTSSSRQRIEEHLDEASARVAALEKQVGEA